MARVHKMDVQQPTTPKGSPRVSPRVSPRGKKVIAPAAAAFRAEPAIRDPVMWFREDCTAEERQRLRTKCKRVYKDIHAACWKGDLDAVRFFLAEDPNAATSKDCFPEDRATFDEMAWNAEYGEPPVGDYNRPLHYAAHEGHLDIAKLLLSRPGVSIDALNGSGCTALFSAAQQGRAPMVRELLKQGADPKLREFEHGLSPVDVSEGETLAEFRVGADGQPRPRPGQLDEPPELLQPRKTSLLVCWRPPPGASGRAALPLAGYKLRLEPVGSAAGEGVPGGVVVQLVPAVAPSRDDAGSNSGGFDEVLSHRVAGLAPGQEYTCKIAAVSIMGAGPFSAPSAPLATGAAPPVLRGQLSVVEVSEEKASLMWAFGRGAAAAATAAAFSEYVLQKAVGGGGGGGGTWEECDIGPAPPTRTTFEVTGLEPQTKYRFRLAARNNAGLGRFCAPITVLTTRAGAGAAAVDDHSDDEPTVEFARVDPKHNVQTVAGPGLEDSSDSEGDYIEGYPDTSDSDSDSN